MGGLCGGLLGTALQLRQAEVASAPVVIGLSLGGLVLLGLHVRLRLVVRSRWQFWLALVGAAALAFAATSWRAQVRLDERLSTALEGVDLQLEGVISSLPAWRGDGVRFVFEVDAASMAGEPAELGTAVPRRVALGWYQGFQDSAVGSWPPSEIGPGQRWRWTVRLRQPHGNLNPHGFDSELWLFEQGLRASGHVRPLAAERPLRLADASGHAVQRWRQQVRAAILARLGPTPAAGILAGLAIGDQTAIDRADWAVFRTTGVAHLLAVSGLHITLFAWMASALVARLWRRSSTCALCWPTPQAARWGGLLAAAAYALLAGWGVPAQRTVYMLAVLTLLRSAGLQWPVSRLLLTCATAVVVLDPWALLQPGFWLSFVAVALLAGSTPVRSGGESPTHGIVAGAAAALQAGWRSQWVASVGLAPWTLIFFNQISVVGLLANSFAIPLVTLLITPLALLGVLLPPCWSLAAWLVESMMVALQWLAGWPGASWQLPAAPVWAQWLGAAGAALLILPWPAAMRLLGGAFLLPMLWPLVPRPPPDDFDLLGVDVGQGNAVLVRTAGHTLLYDTGPLFGRESDAGERVLVPLLTALGERRLDLLMLSHRDADHTGGTAAVLAGPGAVRVMSSLEPGHVLRGLAPHQSCEAGQGWRWDGVDFQVLHPTRADYQRALAGTLRPNGLSCVLRISNGRRTVLLTGDIERQQELSILARHGQGAGLTPQALAQAHGLSLQADVLLVPHHGSRTSSTQNWLNAVRPRWALVQAGYRNRYGHPAADVLERYQLHGVGVIRTDSCGSWHWRSADAAHWCERRRQRRYWHAPLQGDGLEFANDSMPSDESP
jgi:competence protein ComEC